MVVKVKVKVDGLLERRLQGRGGSRRLLLLLLLLIERQLATVKPLRWELVILRRRRLVLQ